MVSLLVSSVIKGARSKISWPLKLAMLLIIVLVLSIVVVQPSDFYGKVDLQHLPLFTRYNGIKAYLACPQEISAVQLHEHSSETSQLNTISARCAELARTLKTSKQIINKILLVNTEEIHADTKFEDICDSLDKTEILTAMQTQFNVTLSEDILPKIATVGDAVGVIEELRNNDGAVYTEIV